MIQVDNYISNPFFDDVGKRKDGTFEFFPAAPKHQKSLDSHPELIEYLTCKDITMRTLMQGLFSLNNELLVFHENGFTSSSKKVIDLSFARLTPIPLSKKSSDYGFTLMKNMKLYELRFKEKQVADTWIDALRKVCIFTNFHHEYELIKVIGKGSFANVCLAESLTDGSFYAVKRFQKEDIMQSEREKLKDLLINEINVLRSLSHENIANLYEVHETQNSIYLVMEVVQGKPLHDIISRPTFQIEYTEDQIISLSYSILSALSYLSSKNIMHRDIKPDNILIQKNGKIVIIDFGLACNPRQSEFAYKICGSPGYIAPEVLKCSLQDKFSAYNEQCDLFSAGCILFYMLYGHALFGGGSTSDNIRLNSSFNYTQLAREIKDEINDPHSNKNKRGLDLVLKMLNPDPRNRINVYEALEHPYFEPMMQNKASQSFKTRSIKSQVSTMNLLNKSTDVDWRISNNTSEKPYAPYAGKEEMSFAQNDSVDTSRVFEREDSSIPKLPIMKIGSAKQLHHKTKSDHLLVQKSVSSPRHSWTMNEMRSSSPKSSFHKLASRRNTGCPAGFLKAAIIRSIQTSHQSMVYSFSDYANLATDPNEDDADEMNDIDEGFLLAKSVKVFTRNQ